MTDKAEWARRVSSWRSSGLTSTAFCEGKSFTAGGLRHWAFRLGQEKKARRRSPGEKPTLRLGRVLRARAPAGCTTRDVPAGAGLVASVPVAPSEPLLVVELGAARLTVRPGIDRETLVMVLDVLAAQEGAR